MKTYQQLKISQAKEMNEFKGIFFAFSNDQFKEGMEKVGLASTDTKLIFSLGAGGYILKTRANNFGNMLKRHTQELKDLRKSEKELVKAIAYELSNHEFCITGDVTDALEILNLTIEDTPKEILKKAIKLHNKNREEFTRQIVKDAREV